jgi:hypothetical protein
MEKQLLCWTCQIVWYRMLFVFPSCVFILHAHQLSYKYMHPAGCDRSQ